MNIREHGPLLPRVIVHNIPADYDQEFIDHSIMCQNASLETFDPCSIRPMFKWGTRGRETTNWVVEVSPKAYKVIVHRRIYIGMISIYPKLFK